MVVGAVPCFGLTRGVVAACVWDHAGERGPLAVFWAAVHELDPAADDESDRAAVRDQCRRLLPAAPAEVTTAWAATGRT